MPQLNHNASLGNASELMPTTQERVLTTISVAEMTANDQWRTVITGVIGLAPHVGGAASGIIAFFWPVSDQDPLQTWNSIKKYAEAFMRNLVDEKIAEERIKQLENRLNGIRTVMQSYDKISMTSRAKGAKFEAVLTHLEGEEQFFLDKRNPERMLVYFLAYATIRLASLRDNVGAYETIFHEKNPDAAQDRKTLVDKIAQYTKHLYELAADFVQWRISQIKLESMSDGHWLNPTTLWIGVDGLDDKWKIERSQKKADIEYKTNNRRDQIKAEFTAAVNCMIESSFLWPYLDPENIKKPTSVPVITKSGPFGGRNGQYFYQAPTGTLTEVRVFAGDDRRICALEMFYNNHYSETHGSTNSSTHHYLKLEEGEYIIAVEGRAGDTNHQMYFITNRGKRIGGGGLGGDPWRASAPLNREARLVAVEGKKGSHSIDGITFHWQYLRDE